ncbi:MAG TPA: transporter [Lachnospiraceae bacterium]|nr:transporter [Lachnospiraceae bacterium]
MKNQSYHQVIPAKAVWPYSVTTVVQAAMIAAIYVVLTFLANAFGLANYAVQIRFSEALTILPYFTPAAIPGLFIGCLLSNILTGCAIPDIVFGSVATLIGAVLTYCLRKYKWLAPVPPIVSNMLIIPFVLLYAYGIRPLWFSFITVTAGEIISCGVLGMALLLALEKYRSKIF